MEQRPQEKKVNGPYQVLWSAGARQDLSRIPQGIVQNILQKTELRLFEWPHFFGQPLKGTMKRLWKLRFGKYRLIYSINEGYKKVYILAVTNRDAVYRNSAVQSLLKLAVALHEHGKHGGL